MIIRRYCRNLYLIGILALLLLASCGQKNNNGWGKPQPFDKEAYDASYDTFIEHFDDGVDKIPLLNHLADSMCAEENYAVQFNGEMIKAQVAMLQDKTSEELDCYLRARDLAKKNGHTNMYFSAYEVYCHRLLDINTMKALIEAKKMIKEADELGSINGLKDGHRVIADLLLYHHNNGGSAIVEYLKVERLAKQIGSSAYYMFDLYMDMATAYIQMENYADARKVLDNARKMPSFKEDYCRTSYYITYLSYIEKVGSAEEFNDIYRQYFLDSSIQNRYGQDEIDNWRVRWLIKTNRYKEAEAALDSLENLETRHVRAHDLYKSLGQYDKALISLEKLNIVRDSVRYQLNMSEIADMDAQLNKAELKKATDEARTERNIILLTSAVIILLLFTLAIVFFLYRQRQVNRRLQEANEVKKKFIQNMSHELRTPINHVYGFAQLLSNEEMADDAEFRKEAVAAIGNGSEMLTRMIEDIMEISELESATEVKLTDSINVHTLVGDVIKSVHVPEEKKTILQIITDIQVPENYAFRSKEEWVRHVLFNIISNAVKFTDSGTITVGVQVKDYAAERSLRKRSALQFIITDTGRGIPAEHREAIFDRFFKVDEFIPGTGLGLSVCRLIARRLGGDVILDTDYQGTTSAAGSRFIFSVDL